MGDHAIDLMHYECEQNRRADEEADEEARMAKLRQKAQDAVEAMNAGSYEDALGLGLDLCWWRERDQDGMPPDDEDFVDHLVDRQQVTDRPAWMQREAAIRRELQKEWPERPGMDQSERIARQLGWYQGELSNIAAVLGMRVTFPPLSEGGER